MSDVVISKGIRQNLLALQSTAELLGRTQNRLATGKKVNSALDNPSNFFISQGLSARANDLSALLDGIGQATQVLQAANNGITSLTKLIETAQATARQSLQSASTTAKVKSSTSFTPATSLVGAAAPQFQAGDVITITAGAASSTFTITAAAGALDTVQDLIDSINTNATLNVPGNPPSVHASLDDSGKLLIESIDGQNLQIALTTNVGAVNTLSDLFGTGVNSTTEATSVARTATENTTRTTLARQYDQIKQQIDQLVKDTGYNGTNLLNGDALKVLFNESSTTSLTIVGVTFDSTGLGLSSADTQNDFQSDYEIGQAQTRLQAALLTLRAQASTFGSNLTIVQTRQDLTKNTIQTLQIGSDQLVVADQNEEGANLLALQTRQQLSTTALSLASQADQAILRLFG